MLASLYFARFPFFLFSRKNFIFIFFSRESGQKMRGRNKIDGCYFSFFYFFCGKLCPFPSSSSQPAPQLNRKFSHMRKEQSALNCIWERGGARGGERPLLPEGGDTHNAAAVVSLYLDEMDGGGEGGGPFLYCLWSVAHQQRLRRVPYSTVEGSHLLNRYSHFPVCIKPL